MLLLLTTQWPFNIMQNRVLCSCISKNDSSFSTLYFRFEQYTFSRSENTKYLMYTYQYYIIKIETLKVSSIVWLFCMVTFTCIYKHLTIYSTLLKSKSFLAILIVLYVTSILYYYKLNKI